MVGWWFAEFVFLRRFDVLQILLTLGLLMIWWFYDCGLGLVCDVWFGAGFVVDCLLRAFVVLVVRVLTGSCGGCVGWCWRMRGGFVT